MKLYLFTLINNKNYYIVEDDINSAIAKLKNYLKINNGDIKYCGTLAINIFDERTGIFE